MKNFFIAMACLLVSTASFATSAQSKNVALLKKSMTSMQPISVKENKDGIYIVLDAAVITPEIYEASTYAVCQPAWLKKSESYLKNTKSVFILNRTNYAGYAFDDPRAACKKAGDEQPEQSKVTILSNSRLFTNKGN